jgi:hypothetical protein
VTWLRRLVNQGDAKNAPGTVSGSGPHRGDGSPTRWREVAGTVAGGSRRGGRRQPVRRRSVAERACSGHGLSERVAEAQGRMEGGEAPVDLKKWHVGRAAAFPRNLTSRQ